MTKSRVLGLALLVAGSLYGQSTSPIAPVRVSHTTITVEVGCSAPKKAYYLTADWNTPLRDAGAYAGCILPRYYTVCLTPSEFNQIKEANK